MTDLALVGLTAAGTLLLRSSLVAMLADASIPRRLEEALRLVAPAVLAGLVAQSLFLDQDGFRTIASWYVASVIAALVAWRTRSVTWTLIVGMSAVWGLEAIA